MISRALVDKLLAARAADPVVLSLYLQVPAAQFLAVVPAGLRDHLAGSFAADPHTLTPARVRELAAPVIEHWVTAREQQLVAQVRDLPPGGLAAAGMHDCVAAVNQHAVQLLLAPDEGLIPGYACTPCAVLAVAGGGCPDCGAALGPVPDLIEEMAVRTLGDGGLVEAASDPPGGVAARLRFPLTRR